jgi:triphosphoribosyl-dephospho-CoA synthase
MGASHLAPGAQRTAGPAPAAWSDPDRRSRVIAAYREVCALELEALKPGNVHRHADGHGMTVADFLRSAQVSAGPLTEPGLGLGERIYRAVAATRAAVGCNTNLGILLLSAPLIQAMLDEPPTGTLRERLGRVLAAADRTDTEGLFQAIRLAAPGGLGRSDAHDVCAIPEARPLEVMSHAADRDRIALQYATGFADLFERAVPLLIGLERRWHSPIWATAGLYMDFLTRFPDTHVARKLGQESALEVCRLAAPVAESLRRANRPQQLRGELLALDRRLKESGVNPGTSADLTVACLLIRRLAPLGAPPDLLSPSTADCRRLSHPGPDAPAPGFFAQQTET